MKKFVLSLGMVVVAALSSVACEKLVADGQTVVFLGDSITHYGANNPYGYVQLVVKGLSANGIVPKWFGAGIPGNKALHMNARFDKDVLARKPDLVTISAGVNDVWFARPDCTLDKYRVDMEQMIERGEAAGVKVVLLTPTTAMGEFNNPNIVKYAECVRELAAKHGLVVADTWKAVRDVIDDPAGAKLVPRGLKATADGVHMAPMGDRAMARCVLRAFGLDDREMARAEKIWNEDVSLCTLKSCVGVPLKTYRALEAEADARACKIEDVYRETFRKGVEATLTGAALEEPKTTPADLCKPDGQKPEIAVIGDYFHFVDQQSRSGLVNFIRRAISATGKDLAVFAEPQFRGGTSTLNAYWDKTLAKRKIAYLVVNETARREGGEGGGEGRLPDDATGAEQRVRFLQRGASGDGRRQERLRSRPAGDRSRRAEASCGEQGGVDLLGWLSAERQRELLVGEGVVAVDRI